ncbi:hypothetical protein QE435_003638 [Rhizobium sp. SORGH_AS 787]|nr:hypothetical protein [Rhizobium sp. SORGH_AS_0787]
MELNRCPKKKALRRSMGFGQGIRSRAVRRLIYSGMSRKEGERISRIRLASGEAGSTDLSAQRAGRFCGRGMVFSTLMVPVLMSSLTVTASTLAAGVFAAATLGSSAALRWESINS